MASKKNVVKRKDIPLTVVKSVKQCKIKHNRGKVASNKSSVGEFNCETVTNQWHDDGYMFDETAADETNTQQPSSHTKRKQKAAERWMLVQSVALNAVVKTLTEPQLNCAECNNSAGVVKCYQCGPHVHYCNLVPLKCTRIHCFTITWKFGR